MSLIYNPPPTTHPHRRCCLYIEPSISLPKAPNSIPFLTILPPPLPISFSQAISLHFSHDWCSAWGRGPIFFVLIFLFICVYILRFFGIIFIWILLGKCEKPDKNVFSKAFLRIQPNTKKYFSKHFLECNKTLENILHWNNRSLNFLCLQQKCLKLKIKIISSLTIKLFYLKKKKFALLKNLRVFFPFHFILFVSISQVL